MPLGADAVEDLPQALAFVVGQPLRDAVGGAVGDEHDEPAGDRHLLGEPGALVGDRVLRDLAQDQLARLQHVLDAGLAAALGLDVVGVVLDVAPVEHCVLRGRDVDERRLHAGQHVLDLADVDVAVDLGDVVGGSGHVVLDQRPTLEDRDLRRLRVHVHVHLVAPDGATLAAPPPTLLHRLLVELERAVVDQHRLDRRRAAVALALLALALLTTGVAATLLALAVLAAAVAVALALLGLALAATLGGRLLAALATPAATTAATTTSAVARVARAGFATTRSAGRPASLGRCTRSGTAGRRCRHRVADLGLTGCRLVRGRSAGATRRCAGGRGCGNPGGRWCALARGRFGVRHGTVLSWRTPEGVR